MPTGRPNGLTMPTNLFVTLMTSPMLLITFLTAVRNQLPRWMPVRMRYISPSLCIISSSGHQGDSNNIFDSLPSLSKLNSTNECDKLDRYLATGVEDITSGGAIKWWYNHRSKYPCLSCMALDYLIIPGKHLNTGSDWPRANIYCSYVCWCWASLQ